jgi:hypothetical protein
VNENKPFDDASIVTAMMKMKIRCDFVVPVLMVVVLALCDNI